MSVYQAGIAVENRPELADSGHDPIDVTLSDPTNTVPKGVFADLLEAAQAAFGPDALEPGESLDLGTVRYADGGVLVEVPGELEPHLDGFPEAPR